jgi:hypothetical protein
MKENINEVHLHLLNLTYTYCRLRLGCDFLMNNGASDMLLYVQTISNLKYFYYNFEIM